MLDTTNAKLTNVLGSDTALGRLRDMRPRDRAMLSHIKQLIEQANDLPDYLKHPVAPTSWEPQKIMID